MLSVSFVSITVSLIDIAEDILPEWMIQGAQSWTAWPSNMQGDTDICCVESVVELLESRPESKILRGSGQDQQQPQEVSAAQNCRSYDLWT